MFFIISQEFAQLCRIINKESFHIIDSNLIEEGVRTFHKNVFFKKLLRKKGIAGF
jgi:hypothetical protein